MRVISASRRNRWSIVIGSQSIQNKSKSLPPVNHSACRQCQTQGELQATGSEIRLLLTYSLNLLTMEEQRAQDHPQDHHLHQCLSAQCEEMSSLSDLCLLSLTRFIYLQTG